MGQRSRFVFRTLPVPGVRGLVAFAEDMGRSQEMFFFFWRPLGGLEARTHMIYSAAGDMDEERLDDYGPCILFTGRRGHPRGAAQAVVISWPLERDEIVELIRRGRGEAVALMDPDGPGPGVSAAIDRDGNRLPLPV